MRDTESATKSQMHMHANAGGYGIFVVDMLTLRTLAAKYS
jgi:hypothetical protein